MEYQKCKKCDKYFSITEHKLEMPGTKEREPINCPYCGNTNDEQVTNGWWNTHKLTENEEEMLKMKSNNSL